METDYGKIIAFNSYGGFNEKGTEYHILNRHTPLPWCNVIANENFGSIISNKGTVYTYFKNSREFKITNWSNDWIGFEPGETFKGIFEEDYNIIYGFGYVKVYEEANYLKKTMDIFIPMKDNMKVQYITIENTSGEQMYSKIEYKLDPVLGVNKESTYNFILAKEINDKMVIKNPYNEYFSESVVFSSVLTDPENEELTENKVSYFYDLDNYSTTVEVTIEPYAKVSYALILGVSEHGERDIFEKIDHSTLDNIKEMYDETKKYWKDLVTKNFKTGDRYTDIMANGWLLYQTVACRLYARSAFYQSGGAIGFRDQLQDSIALIRTRPQMTRDQIILHSSKQFEKGDVLHWWHNHNMAGIRTYFSDDYLWLPYVLTEYIKITNDYSILEVRTPFLENKEMGAKRELYDVYRNIDVDASVYEHSKKAIMFGLSRVDEKNGLLEIGDGDWNDGFSNIRGQSVWLSLFMMNILDRFEEISNSVRDFEMVKTCQKERHKLKHSVISNAWDGNHFLRAFFENGEVLGSERNSECKIDLISQAWSAISLKNYPDAKGEIEQAIASADKYLVDHKNKIVSLLYPPFDRPKNNPGYIKAYVPGTRENGGQYTHASAWLAKAYFEMGEYDNGIEILKILNPIYHADTKDKADIYMVEPFVIAADIYTNPEHLGRGGWTWYTGSSAWIYKVIEDYVKKDN